MYDIKATTVKLCCIE